MHLRLDPARNNQSQGIKWARDYEYEPVITRMRSLIGTRRAATL
jgi:hypothetical protein